MHSDSATDRRQRGGFWDNLVTGLKVLASELRWMVIGRLRAFEIRQLRHRLKNEYETLGRLAEPVMAATEAGKRPTLSAETRRDADLSLKQIDFLREEIDLLEDERRRSRHRFEQQRAEELGLKQNPDPAQDN